jgi:hypothetical protein
MRATSLRSGTLDEAQCSPATGAPKRSRHSAVVTSASIREHWLSRICCGQFCYFQRSRWIYGLPVALGAASRAETNASFQALSS